MGLTENVFKGKIIPSLLPGNHGQIIQIEQILMQTSPLSDIQERLQLKNVPPARPRKGITLILCTFWSTDLVVGGMKGQNMVHIVATTTKGFLHMLI